MFTVDVAILADVFDEPPGVEAEEIVCTFKELDVTHTAICIYRLDGVLLYRAWIDNYVMELHWLSDARVLAVAGLNGEVTNSERVIENPPSRRSHPDVVFGYPSGARIHKRRIHRTGRNRTRGPNRPADSALVLLCASNLG